MFRSLRGELRRARIGKVRGHIKQCLTLIIEVRRQHRFAGMLQAQSLTNVLESTAYSERSRSEHSAFQLRPQAFAQNGANVDRRSLQKNVMPSSFRDARSVFVWASAPWGRARSSATAAALNPKHCIVIV